MFLGINFFLRVARALERTLELLALSDVLNFSWTPKPMPEWLLFNLGKVRLIFWLLVLVRQQTHPKTYIKLNLVSSI